MSFQRIWSWLLGFLVIRVEGESLEKFVNMAASRGIVIWDIIKMKNNNIIIKVRISSLRPLRHIRQRVGCRISILSKEGLPFWLWQLRRRKLLTAGGLLFVITLYVMASFVWFIEINGTARIPEAEIRKVLANEGLEPWVWKRNLDLNELGKSLTNQISGLAWAGLEMRGTRIIVRVVEKVLPNPKASQSPADVVAKREGLVTEVLVLEGEAKVKAGEVVQPGQVLIAGEVHPPERPGGVTAIEEEGTAIPVPVRQVSARGIVKARTWHQSYGQAQLVEKGLRFSGASVERISIKWGSREIIIKGPKVIPYAYLDRTESRKKLPSWRNIVIPVEVINTVFRELVPYSIEHDLEEATQLALQKARAELQPKLAPEYKLLKERVEEVPTGQEYVIKLRLTLETLEDIGKVQYWK